MLIAPNAKKRPVHGVKTCGEKTNCAWCEDQLKLKALYWQSELVYFPTQEEMLLYESIPTYFFTLRTPLCKCEKLINVVEDAAI